MVNPRTVNAGIIVPLTGADVDLWGEVDVNPNMVAIDGFIGGVQTIAVTGAAPVTLTAPAGFTATPTPGPTQSQNRVLRFTGALAANQQITLPLPGVYVVENLTTGAFVLSFRGAVAATEVIGTPQGDRVTIYNDGSNVRFVDLGKVGEMEFWAGLSAMPAWVAACTSPPYLLCDGSAAYTFAQFPYLGARMGSAFGGNGITTFGTPDMQGRYPLAYDGTGTRITTAKSGINGQQMGNAGGSQATMLATTQVPTLTSVNLAQAITVNASGNVPLSTLNWAGVDVAVTAGAVGLAFSAGSKGNATSFSKDNSISVTYTNNAQQYIVTVPPAQVAGIWVIKT